MPRNIKASEFKAKCLALMDGVARTGTAVVITKNGKPVAELVPHRPRMQTARGIPKDELFITGDIVRPIDAVWRTFGGVRPAGYGNKVRSTRAVRRMGAAQLLAQEIQI
jgi:prevent-host-death family protein